MQCTKCGKGIAHGANFCGECGQQIIAESSGSVDAQAEEANSAYTSEFNNETINACLRGGKPGFVFEETDLAIGFFKKDAYDLVRTDKRICVLLGEKDIKNPEPSSAWLPVGGPVGGAANVLLKFAINSYRNKKFIKQHGAGPSAEQIDLLCFQGNGIYAAAPIRVYLFKGRQSFMGLIDSVPVEHTLFYCGQFHYQGQLLRGGIYQIFGGTVSEARTAAMKTAGVELIVIDEKLIDSERINRMKLMIKK